MISLKTLKTKSMKISKIIRNSLLVVGVALFAVSLITKIVHVAASTCSSIADCQQQINDANGKVSDLKNTATSYQNAINTLNAEINQYQFDINTNQAKMDALNAQIVQAKADIETNKATLAADIKSMYVNGQVSMFEELATSKNLSTFVDGQTYRSAVNREVQNTLAKLSSLETDLNQKQTQVSSLLADDKNKQNALYASQSQQQTLLSFNNSQIDSYNAQTSQNQQKLNALIAAQKADNSSNSGGYYFIHFPGTITADPLNGSYPYANYGFSMSTAPGCGPVDSTDNWGYCTRQCVSYAAWAVEYSGRSAPIDWGSARDWVGGARNTPGVTFDAVPEAGDVAISTHGTWGHAMYIEQVSGNQMYVSQYNQQLDGQFSTQWRSWQ